MTDLKKSEKSKYIVVTCVTLYKNFLIIISFISMIVQLNLLFIEKTVYILRA
jgi:hypothetical protein